jgi:carbonic anhydrase
MKILLLQFTLIVIVAIACNSPKKEQESHQSNTDGLYTLPGLDHGLIQSPINILTSDLHKVGSQELKVIGPNDDIATAVVNQGHTIELEMDPGAEILFQGINYQSKQMHFHTPSEHQIDGMTFPMEVHFVSMHTEPDQERPEYLVFSGLFKMGKENAFISQFINKIPKHEHDTVSLEVDPIYIEDLVANLSPDRKYYHYKGSLTTPPYTETVHWLILRDVLEASPEQIKSINELEGNNARRVQAGFGREVEVN